jgi:hypothetical protein
MTNLLFFVLLVAVIITAGCVSENQNSAVSPTPLLTPTQATIFRDLIIGTWQSDSGLKIIFFENGKASWNNQGMTWEKYDDTHYALSQPYGMTYVFTYDPQSQTITTTNGGNPIILKRM